MEDQHVLYLVRQQFSGQISPAERAELQSFLQDAAARERFVVHTSQLMEESGAWDIYRADYWEPVLQAVLESDRSGEPTVVPVHRIHFLRRSFFRYAAAIILLIGVTIAIVMSSDRQSNKYGTDLSKKTDILPGGNKAILTLADGSKIILDGAANGNLAQQGNAAIVKLANGQIAYNLKGLAEGNVMMNTMSTPKGGQYQLMLPDGTKVWLNAASSITYPAAFIGEKRNVKVTGEVYFEVAKNKQKPFMVDVDGKSLIEVLGTSFNINSYSNEENIRATLVEGSVKILKGSKEAILKPGYQAVVASSDQQPGGKNAVIQVQVANVDQTLAWKNGIFNFDGLDLKSAMRQLERWYDIKVQYQRPVSDEIIIKGGMYRRENLSFVLGMLNDIGVKCKIDGKTLIIL